MVVDATPRWRHLAATAEVGNTTSHATSAAKTAALLFEANGILPKKRSRALVREDGFATASVSTCQHFLADAAPDFSQPRAVASTCVSLVARLLREAFWRSRKGRRTAAQERATFGAVSLTKRGEDPPKAFVSCPAHGPLPPPCREPVAVPSLCGGSASPGGASGSQAFTMASKLLETAQDPQRGMPPAGEGGVAVLSLAFIPANQRAQSTCMYQREGGR